MLAKTVSRRLINLPKSRYHIMNMNNSIRHFSFSFMESTDGEEFALWPRTHPNTILNVCPQGELMIIERLGKLHSVEQAGMFVAIPIMDHISFRIDVRNSTSSINIIYNYMYMCMHIVFTI